MQKLLFYVTFFALLLTGNYCLFAGDSCVAEDQAGTCSLLSECQPLLIEIRSAGAPMPASLRRKLQGLSCGFQSDEPIVCCLTPYTNGEDPNTDFMNWPITHGLGVGNPNPEPNRGNPNPWTTESSGNHWPSGNNNNRWPTESTVKPWTSAPTWNNQKPVTTDSRRQTIAPVPNRPVTTNKDSPPNIARHRNLGLLPTNCGLDESDKIWGGNRVALFEMPWMVLISYDTARGSQLSCGGTLITERYVLTAAHCVSFLGDRLKLSGVLIGEYDVREDPDCETTDGERLCAPSARNVSIDRVIAHPGYSPQNLYDDIALIRLAEPADFSLDNMKPICLPDTAELLSEDLTGTNGVVSGWGATEDGLQSPVLLSVALPIVDNSDCQAAYKGNPKIYNRQMCAGGVEDKDSCGGDSGGPLVYPGKIRSGAVRLVQRGVVSYGTKRCGLGGFPGVYTRVAFYMDWILDNIGD